MITFLRYSLGVMSQEYPYKAPTQVQSASKDILTRMQKYLLYKNNDIVHIPIDTMEYEQVMEFREKYKPYTSNLIMYEYKFSKKEMDNADFYLLQCSSLLEIFYEMRDTFTTCCEKSNYRNKQVGYYRIRENAMKTRVIAFTYDYRFVISEEAKERLERECLTNFEYLPVYGKSSDNIVAYQLECKQMLKPLADLNGWSICKECDHCHKIYWNPVHEVPHPFLIPLKYKEEMSDINATSEVFTNTGSRYYIISKKVYHILKELGAKKLMCEPIVFIENSF